MEIVLWIILLFSISATVFAFFANKKCKCHKDALFALITDNNNLRDNNLKLLAVCEESRIKTFELLENNRLQFEMILKLHQDQQSNYLQLRDGFTADNKILQSTLAEKITSDTKRISKMVEKNGCCIENVENLIDNLHEEIPDLIAESVFDIKHQLSEIFEIVRMRGATHFLMNILQEQRDGLARLKNIFRVGIQQSLKALFERAENNNAKLISEIQYNRNSLNNIEDYLDRFRDEMPKTLFAELADIMKQLEKLITIGNNQHTLDDAMDVVSQNSEVGQNESDQKENIFVDSEQTAEVAHEQLVEVPQPDEKQHSNVIKEVATDHWNGKPLVFIDEEQDQEEYKKGHSRSAYCKHLDPEAIQCGIVDYEDMQPVIDGIRKYGGHRPRAVLG